MTTPFRITSTSIDETTALEVRGEVDMAAGRQLEHEFRTLRDTGCRRILVNLSRVTFMDTYGLAILVKEVRRRSDPPTTLEIIAPSPTVRRLFELAGIAKVMPVVADPR